MSDGASQNQVISGDLTLDGLFIFEAIVFLVNIKIMFQTFKYTFFSFFWQIGSIINFFIGFAILNSMKTTSIYDMMPKLFSFRNSYLLLFFIVSSYVLIEFGISVVDDLIQDHLDQQEEDKELEAEFEARQQQMTRGRKLTEYKRKFNWFHFMLFRVLDKGFAFDGEGGHDGLITDNLIGRLENAI